MPDYQEETLVVVGIVRRWKDDGSLILYMPEVFAAYGRHGERLIESYMDNGGHAAGSWRIALDLTEKTDKTDPGVLEFVKRYEKNNNVVIKLRTRNVYEPTINGD